MNEIQVVEKEDQVREFYIYLLLLFIVELDYADDRPVILPDDNLLVLVRMWNFVLVRVRSPSVLLLLAGQVRLASRTVPHTAAQLPQHRPATLQSPGRLRSRSDQLVITYSQVR